MLPSEFSDRYILDMTNGSFINTRNVKHSIEIYMGRFFYLGYQDFPVCNVYQYTSRVILVQRRQRSHILGSKENSKR